MMRAPIEGDEIVGLDSWTVGAIVGDRSTVAEGTGVWVGTLVFVGAVVGVGARVSVGATVGVGTRVSVGAGLGDGTRVSVGAGLGDGARVSVGIAPTFDAVVGTAVDSGGVVG